MHLKEAWIGIKAEDTIKAFTYLDINGKKYGFLQLVKFVIQISFFYNSIKSINNHSIITFYPSHSFTSSKPLQVKCQQIARVVLDFPFFHVWVGEHNRHLLGWNPKSSAIAGCRYLLNKVASQPLEEQHIGDVEEKECSSLFTDHTQRSV